jgi:hypothetical protein
MFQKAIAIASEFTFPLVMSRKTVAGACSSSVGTFVVVNKAGWIVTAAHILNQWTKLVASAAATQAALAKIKTIKEDGSLSNKERARALAAGPTAGKDDTERCSMWVGINPAVRVNLKNIGFVPLEIAEWGEVVDLACAQLDPWDSAWVKTYPIFKDPTKDFEPGRSLCKLGFPFHQFQTSWDEATNQFKLPPGALPMTRFPVEGMFTRVSEIVIEGEAPPYPIRYVETSTPGLRGQSGGPTFDVHGTIWAIQAKTSHLPLGFTGQNQFLNVGLGVHPETMFPIFAEAGIEYQVSAY